MHAGSREYYLHFGMILIRDISESNFVQSTPPSRSHSRSQLFIFAQDRYSNDYDVSTRFCHGRLCRMNNKINSDDNQSRLLRLKQKHRNRHHCRPRGRR